MYLSVDIFEDILGHTAQTAIFIGMVKCRMESLDKSWVIQKTLICVHVE